MSRGLTLVLVLGLASALILRTAAKVPEVDLKAARSCPADWNKLTQDQLDRSAACKFCWHDPEECAVGCLPHEADLIGVWTFQEGEGTQIADLHGVGGNTYPFSLNQDDLDADRVVWDTERGRGVTFKTWVGHDGARMVPDWQSVLAASNEFTVEVWLRFSGEGNTDPIPGLLDPRRIFDFSDGAPASDSFLAIGEAVQAGETSYVLRLVDRNAAPVYETRTVDFANRQETPNPTYIAFGLDNDPLDQTYILSQDGAVLEQANYAQDLFIGPRTGTAGVTLGNVGGGVEDRCWKGSIYAVLVHSEVLPAASMAENAAVGWRLESIAELESAPYCGDYSRQGPDDKPPLPFGEIPPGVFIAAGIVGILALSGIAFYALRSEGSEYQGHTRRTVMPNTESVILVGDVKPAGLPSMVPGAQFPMRKGYGSGTRKISRPRKGSKSSKGSRSRSRSRSRSKGSRKGSSSGNRKNSSSGKRKNSSSGGRKEKGSRGKGSSGGRKVSSGSKGGRRRDRSPRKGPAEPVSVAADTIPFPGVFQGTFETDYEPESSYPEAVSEAVSVAAKSIASAETVAMSEAPDFSDLDMSPSTGDRFVADESFADAVKAVTSPESD